MTPVSRLACLVVVACLGCPTVEDADGGGGSTVPGEDGGAGLDAGAPPGDAGETAGADASVRDASVPDVDPLAPWYQADPQGRTTQGNVSGTDGEMLVVTSVALRDAWLRYAWQRSLAGIHTEVVTVDEAALAHPAAVDDAEAVRDEIRLRYGRSMLRFVLLGGDAQHVPFRRVEDAITVITGESYTTNGPAELYFADLDTNWDGNSNGRFGEKGEVTLEQMRQPEVAVGRVPASTVAEVDTYLAKVQRYESEATRTTYPLLLSDVASSVPVLGEIDAAEGIEPTVNATFPAEFKTHARRLYGTQGAATKFGGELLTPQGVHDALAEGFPVVMHQGHGSHNWLTDVLDGSWVEDLDNDLPTLFASCACLSGNFADVATGGDWTYWDVQGPDDDSAGERLVVRPHGAVAYVGDTGVGLGPIGGSQFLQAFFDGLFVQGLTNVGEAFNAGHAQMRAQQISMMWVPMTVTDNSERWTHLVIILLGDPSVRVGTAVPAPLGLSAPADYGPGWNELTATVTSRGAPVAYVTVTAGKTGDFLIPATSDAAGNVTFRFLPRGPGPLVIEARATGFVPARAEVAPRL